MDGEMYSEVGRKLLPKDYYAVLCYYPNEPTGQYFQYVQLNEELQRQVDFDLTAKLRTKQRLQTHSIKYSTMGEVPFYTKIFMRYAKSK